MKNKILIIDDEPNIRWTLSELFSGSYDVFTADGSAKIFDVIIQEEPDLIFLDLRLKKNDGMDILRQINKKKVVTTVIVITAYGSIETAVEALKLGAYDYITKPFDINRVKLISQKALEKTRLSREVIHLRSQLEGRYSLEGIIGKSPKMQKIFTAIKKLGEVDSTVLLQGESGTGKDIIARAIHFKSFRREGPFIVVNCAALPQCLLESELFGYERGAFTGAVARKLGKFQLANKGTLFLDEISTLSLDTQAKLLRAVENKQIEPLGGNKSIKIDVRIIVASNDNLEKLVGQGAFRADLFYRLSIIPIYLPPLRDRKEDIPLLADHFLKVFNKKYSQVSSKSISKEFLSLLMEYSWPGNVRELSNVIERAVVMSEGSVLTPKDLPYDIRIQHKGEGLFLSNTLSEERKDSFKDIKISLIRDYEIKSIIRELKETGWNKSKAAERLGISRRSLLYKLKKYRIKKE
ncbi:MAG: sigma-54 dependent transcriptional regulator [Atribacterota bacterium]